MSKIILAEQASAPSTPSAGKVAVYADGNGNLAWKNDAAAVGVAANVNAANTFSAAQTMAAGINVGVAGALLSLFADGVIRQVLDSATLANDATLVISSRSRGLVYVDVAALGVCALYSVDSAGSTLIAGNATYFGTAAGTASKFNVYNNAGQLTLQNKYGSTSTVLVLVIG